MKKLALIATICITLGLLCVLVPSLVFAQSWASYSDSAHATPSDEFTQLHCTVYMYGAGFTKNAYYKIIYWDGGGNKRVSEVTKALGPQGELSSEHTFDVPDVAGNWHCTVYYPDTYDPASYDPGDANIIADDTSYSGGYAFYAAQSTVPEFPTVMAGIGVAGLCFGIYYWMRKKRLGYVTA